MADVKKPVSLTESQKFLKWGGAWSTYIRQTPQSYGDSEELSEHSSEESGELSSDDFIEGAEGLSEGRIEDLSLREGRQSALATRKRSDLSVTLSPQCVLIWSLRYY